MAFRFNPSTTQQTNQFQNMIGSLLQQEMAQKAKKEATQQDFQQQIKLFKLKSELSALAEDKDRRFQSSLIDKDFQYDEQLENTRYQRKQADLLSRYGFEEGAQGRKFDQEARMLDKRFANEQQASQAERDYFSQNINQLGGLTGEKGSGYISGIDASGRPQLKFMSPKEQMELQQMKQVQKMMGFGEGRGDVEDAQFTEGPSQQLPTNIPPQAAMSLISGGAGDVQGMPIQQQIQQLQQQQPVQQPVQQPLQQRPQAKRTSPFRPKSFSAGGVSFERIKSREEEDAEIELKARAQAATSTEKSRQLNVSKISRLTNIIDTIEKKFKETKTPGGLGGVVRRPFEIAAKGLQLTENQRVDTAYRDFVAGIRAQLARAMGDVGNLSETEQKAAMALVPTLWDDPDTAQKKITNLRDFVKQVQVAAEQARPGRKKKKQGKETNTDDEYNRYLQAIGGVQ